MPASDGGQILLGVVQVPVAADHHRDDPLDQLQLDVQRDGDDRAEKSQEGGQDLGGLAR